MKYLFLIETSVCCYLDDQKWHWRWTTTISSNCTLFLYATVIRLISLSSIPPKMNKFEKEFLQLFSSFSKPVRDDLILWWAIIRQMNTPIKILFDSLHFLDIRQDPVHLVIENHRRHGSFWSLFCSVTLLSEKAFFSVVHLIELLIATDLFTRSFYSNILVSLVKD